MDFELRVATEDDLDFLESFVNNAYRGEEAKKGWTTEAEILGGQRIDKKMLLSSLASENTQILLLQELSSGEVKACCELRKDGQQCEIGMLTVSPNEQGKGLGRIMLNKAESYVQEEWKLNRVIMKVISLREELISWYQRRGYTLTGESEAFPSDDPKFGLPKRKDLKFFVMAKVLF